MIKFFNGLKYFFKNTPIHIRFGFLGVEFFDFFVGGFYEFEEDGTFSNKTLMFQTMFISSLLDSRLYYKIYSDGRKEFYSRFRFLPTGSVKGWISQYVEPFNPLISLFLFGLDVFSVNAFNLLLYDDKLDEFLELDTIAITVLGITLEWAYRAKKVGND
ncbi:MAG: hypothetical protein QW279_08940 [Candidatus Jordarchaeaceae archaeon]